MRVQFGALLVLAIAACAFDESGLPAGGTDGGIVDPVADAARADAAAPVDGAVDATPDAFVDDDAPACMTNAQYVGRPNQSHRYRPVAQAASFEDAEDACAADEAYLVVIEDQAENVWVRGLQNGEQWIGLDDRDDEGDYQWANGVDLERGVDYENWATGEPNNSWGAEDCVEMLDDGRWNDSDCDDSLRYVCECDPDWDPDDD
jgi:hypothetical protein